MELLSYKVNHRALGNGTVIDQSAGYITVEFSTKTSKFLYPDAFTNFLECQDASTQSLILEEIANARAVIEMQRRSEEEAQRRAEIQRIATETAKKDTTRKAVSQKKLIQKQARIPGKRMTFYVFQGNTFDSESRGGYIWAPISNKAGDRIHHWERLTDVKTGDIIFHGCDGYVRAISMVAGECYDCDRPMELQTEDLWDKEGRKVDCDYSLIKNPIQTNDFVDDILRLCNEKYAPFDKNGSGNMGYLFELNRELARIFLRASLKYNTYIEDIDFIQELLVETDND